MSKPPVIESVWITKFSLTKGLYEAEVEIIGGPTSMVKIYDSRFPRRLTQYFHRGDWWSDKSDATAKAEDMKARKIANLKKQIAKLEAMKF